jgi:hypothetical protein
MISHRRRIEHLETKFMPGGRTVCLWGMTDRPGRLKTEEEIEAEIAAGARAGTFAQKDKFVIVTWKIEKKAD